jgi:hypothetical protein
MQTRRVLDFLLTESGRPVTWLALVDRDDMPGCLEGDAQEG